MKKIITVLSFWAITAAAFAGSNKTKTITPLARLDYAIQTQVAYPHFLEDRQGSHVAELYFSINPNGKLTVKDIKCDEADLKENLLYQALGFTVSTEGLSIGDTYKVVLHFNTL